MADKLHDLVSKEQQSNQVGEVPARRKSSSRNKTLLVIVILLLIVLVGCITSIFLYSVLKSRGDGEGLNIIEDILDIFRTGETTDSSTDTEQEEDSSTNSAGSLQADSEGDDSGGTESDGDSSTSYSSCIATGFDGEEYAHEDSYTTLDGCQTCTCNNGDWECSVEERCIAPEADCVHEGEALNIGEEVVSDDGCYRWVCEGVGYIAGYFDETCCIRLGEYYQDGETIDEECQDCICNEGAWDCDLEPTCCRYGDRVYANGDTFPHEDGCNTCRCNSGDVSCTTMLCP